MQPDLARIDHQLGPDHKPVPRGIVRSPNHFGCVYILQQFHSLDRDGRPLWVHARVKNIVSRFLFLSGRPLSECERRAEIREEVRPLFLLWRTIPGRLPDGAVTQVGEEEAQVEHGLRPLPFGEELGTRNYEDATATTRGILLLQPSGVVLDWCCANL